ncbi:adenosylcobinamide kinase [Anopheles sinensis]|uniref:Adenosylcobinamide kinase n=1 Tax=Anopheles sinensis TaxID=74873 RepID=A0A084WTQ4_ANOSI|nr:adenosylcobinamide kinase [Anopheles sinensis]
MGSARTETETNGNVATCSRARGSSHVSPGKPNGTSRMENRTKVEIFYRFSVGQPIHRPHLDLVSTTTSCPEDSTKPVEALLVALTYRFTAQLIRSRVTSAQHATAGLETGLKIVNLWMTSAREDLD